MDLLPAKYVKCHLAEMGKPDAAQRVRERILEWVKREGHGSKSRLASVVPANYGTHKSRSWATSIQKTRENKGQDVRLKDLDDVAHLMGVPPGELVRAYDRNYLELTMAEMRLVEYYRAMPETVRQHWLRFLDFVFKPHLAEALAKNMETMARTKTARKHEAERARVRGKM